MRETTAEDRCRGVLVGLAAGDQIGGPIRVAVRLAACLLACGGFNPAATPPISGPLSHHPHNLTESAPRKRPFCAFSYRPQNRLQGGAPCWF